MNRELETHVGKSSPIIAKSISSSLLNMNNIH